MSSPGVGTPVVYHQAGSDSAVYSVPALVAITHDSWSSQGATDYDNYPATQPSAGEVYLVLLGPDLNAGNPVTGLAGPYSEGSSAGEFSLLTMESEDV